MTTPFARTIAGAGSLDLRIISGAEEHIELVTKDGEVRHLWRPLPAGMQEAEEDLHTANEWTRLHIGGDAE